MDFDKLVGQFLISRYKNTALKGWQNKSLHGQHLYAHPTVKVIDLVDEHDQLVGWMVGEPTLGGSLVEGRFLIPLQSAEVSSNRMPQYEARLYELGGPWVAIILEGRLRRVYMDALAHMSIVYSSTAEAVATSTSLIPETADTPMDEDLVSLMRIPERDNWYPFGLTPRKNIFRLLPNHYLDLNRWSTVRHWPRDIPTEAISTEAAAKRTTDVLKKNVAALIQAYPLQMSLTAGYDSRMILASVREYVEDMRFVTNRSHPSTTNLDVEAAKYLSQRLGLDHIVREPSKATQREKEAWLFQTGAAGAGAAFRHLRLTNQYGTERMRLSGQGGGVITAYFYKSKDPKNFSKQYTAEDIVSLLDMPYNGQILQAAREWLEGTPSCSGETLLDLLYVEQKMGCWAGPLRYGGTSAHRVFWPICHRSMLELMLLLPARIKRTRGVHFRVVEREWSDLLEIPFNEWWGWERTKRVSMRKIKRLRPDRVFRGLLRRVRRLL